MLGIYRESKKPDGARGSWTVLREYPDGDRILMEEGMPFRLSIALFVSGMAAIAVGVPCMALDAHGAGTALMAVSVSAITLGLAIAFATIALDL